MPTESDATVLAADGAGPRGSADRRGSVAPGSDPDGRVLLRDFTTIGLGGPAPAMYDATDPAELADLMRRLDHDPAVLVLGGGSNLVIADEGTAGPVVRVGIDGLDVEVGDDGTATVTIGAGTDWDTAVAELVDDGWCGLESLSGIPGSAGATPVQNVGAYGAEIADVLVDVEVYDRVERRPTTMTADSLRLGYRSSVLRGTDRAVVTAVRLRLSRRPGPVRYAELARTLGVSVGDRAPAGDVRSAVLELRRGKGMVIDPADPDTRSVGSFFTNPILGAEEWQRTRSTIASRLGADVPVPSYPAGRGDDGEAVKLSAAWLIERAGFAKGYPLAQRPGAPAALSTKHTLALTNRGGSTADLLALAREIRDGVREAFGVLLRPEPVLVGVRL